MIIKQVVASYFQGGIDDLVNAQNLVTPALELNAKILNADGELIENLPLHIYDFCINEKGFYLDLRGYIELELNPAIGVVTYKSYNEVAYTRELFRFDVVVTSEDLEGKGFGDVAFLVNAEHPDVFPLKKEAKSYGVYTQSCK